MFGVTEAIVGGLGAAGFCTMAEVVPDTPPRLAVTVTVPALAPIATPSTPDVLPIKSTLLFEEVHVTEVVRF